MSTIYNSQHIFTTVYNIYTINMYISHQNIFQSKHCNSVVFKFFVHVAYGFLYIILTGFPVANIIRRNWVSLNRLIILLSKCTLSSSLPKIHFSLGLYLCYKQETWFFSFFYHFLTVFLKIQKCQLCARRLTPSEYYFSMFIWL